jgi:hypothetical protein
MPTPQHLLLLSEMSDKKNSINHQRRLVLEIKKNWNDCVLARTKISSRGSDSD